MRRRRDQPEGTSTDWGAVVERLGGRDRESLSPVELETLSDALFWTDSLKPSIQVRSDAYRAHLAHGDLDGAAMAAWRLFYEHWLVGETVVGRSWLDRARSHLEQPHRSAVAGWLGIADTDLALAEGRTSEAVDVARAALSIAETVGEPNLVGMALQALGRAEIGSGDAAVGLRRLDQAMIMVVGNELDAHFTGWVYCNLIATCHGLADLKRANEWCEAALRWCESLKHGELYPGLCRVYAAELALLRGEWEQASESAQRACASLAAHDERYAGAAHYVTGDLARLRGNMEAAEAAYERAHRLGYLPQPGLALLRFSQGEVTTALAALRSAAHPGPATAIARSRFASALVEVAIAADDADAVALARSTSVDVGLQSDSPVVATLERSVAGQVAAWRGDHGVALGSLRKAFEGFRVLRMRYEAARERERIGRLCATGADAMTAHMEFRAALDDFEKLGAAPDAERVRAEMSSVESAEVCNRRGLSERELEVLRLVAGGLTNREVAAELFISEHTVARHLANIYTKLDVGSRAAATARAYSERLIDER